MGNFLTFNGDTGIPQPTTLKEDIMRHVHDRVSVTGVTRRIWMADKFQVTLSWQFITTAQYDYLAQYLYNAGAAVNYYNLVTGLAFTGFPTSAADEFVKGNNFLRHLTATIVQI